jgi:hypothetical protein
MMTVLVEVEVRQLGHDGGPDENRARGLSIVFLERDAPRFRVAHEEVN